MFEDFRERLLLADRLEKIKIEVYCYEKIQYHYSLVRKWKGAPASPFPPMAMIDYALEHGEATIDQLEQ